MPSLKRKPVLYQPLPSLSTILQSVSLGSKDVESTPPPPPPKSKKSKANAASNQESEAPPTEGGGNWVPPDADNDEDQLKLLASVFDDGFANGTVGKGKKAGTWIVNGSVNLPGSIKSEEGEQKGEGSKSKSNGNGNGHGNGNGEMAPPPIPESSESWKITDPEVYYIPETGEIFTDYDSYLARMNFYNQPLFQCEVTGKSAMSYFAAYANERKEIRQLHTRFPKQLKKAVLTAVQFQIEGKLETLADKVYERFVNRFFDDEKVFVDVQGDKYLARIVKTFPPRSLASSPLRNRKIKSESESHLPVLEYHTLGADLSLEPEEVVEQDDPMKYFYSARLIVEGAGEGDKGGDEDGSGEEFEGSVMEVQADKISRDRINFSRAMLKRFIRDCVQREAAVYSPWTVKPAVAARYGIPTEMSDTIREQISTYRERQMDRRKREREERLGITADDTEEVKDEKEKPSKKKQKKETKEEIKIKLEQQREEEEKKKRKPLKYPAEDFLVEYGEKDEKEERPLVRPVPNKQLPFGDQFEKLLLSWTFLNVMGKPLGISPFTLDEFEQSLYHKDWSSPAPLMVEIHACILNALIRDLRNGAEPIKPTVAASASASAAASANPPSSDLTSEGEDADIENDADYWEGNKGATTETLRPIATDLANIWASRLYTVKDGRKGWESALVGLLWERATLQTLPTYLDNILHLTFEDKPAPTRPTWSTGPSTTSSVNGLIPSKPERRWSSIHHSHKLDIIAWMIGLVSQTAVVRDFMEESTAALTEVRKEQIDNKREWKQLQAKKEALEPKKETNGDHPDGEPNGNGDGNGNGDAELNDGDEIMAISRQPNTGEQSTSPSAHQTEQDELDIDIEESPPLSDIDDASDVDAASETGTDTDRHLITTASRRQAMASKAASRAEEEALRLQSLKAERELSKIKKSESKALTLEKRRIEEEQDRLTLRLRELEYEFRSHLYTLRARPMGIDRFGNKVWWMDGLGSSAPLQVDRKYNYGTGRVYLQGVDDEEWEYMVESSELTKEEVEGRRQVEEGEGRLNQGEWGMYESVSQVQEFTKWLNPRGTRDLQLLKSLKAWIPEIEGGIQRRRTVLGLDKTIEEEEEGYRRRPTRKVAGGEEEGYMGWKNKRAT